MMVKKRKKEKKSELADIPFFLYHIEVMRINLAFC